MALLLDRSMSVTEAGSRGIPALVRDAEEGRDSVVERHGKPVAAILGMRRLVELNELEADLRSAALVLSRIATDDGRRTSLDDLIGALGYDRAELEAELDAELRDDR